MYTLDFYPSLVKVLDNKSSFIEGSIIVFHDGRLRHVFKANSGGYGNGCFEHGVYRIKSVKLLPEEDKWSPYKRDGKPWWAPITPLFKTKRTSLGAHPDGGVPGTLGCLGLLEDDMLFYKVLSDILLVQNEVELTVY